MWALAPEYATVASELKVKEEDLKGEEEKVVPIKVDAQPTENASYHKLFRGDRVKEVFDYEVDRFFIGWK